MLQAQNWRTSEVLRLFALLATSILGAQLVLQAAQALLLSEGQELPPWVLLTAGFVSLHIPGLVLLTFFLYQHQTTWVEGFSIRWRPIKPVILLAVGFVVPSLLLAFPLQEISSLILQRLGYSTAPQEAVLILRDSSGPARWLIGFFAIGVAPVVEEGLFRGVLYPVLRKRIGWRSAMLLTSVTFGLVHFNRSVFLSLTLFGLALVWLYETSSNLLPCILAHALFNLVGFLIAITEWSPFD